MLRIGLTGGIGSGKTTVAGIFEVLGVPVSYADQDARLLMNRDEDLKKEIIRHFGKASYDKQGRLDRAWVSKQVFGDPQKLALLNALVHPVTLRESAKWMAQQEALKVPYAIKEAALIFESRAAQGLDLVIGVRAPQELRIIRAMHRDHITRGAVVDRMRYQISEDLKMRLCDFVIQNDDREALLPQMLLLHEKLLERAATITSTLTAPL